MSIRDLIKWRAENYLSTFKRDNEGFKLEISYEISNILAEWHLESKNIKIPQYQYTTEDFEFSTRWSHESMNYSTEVLFPVVSELIANSSTENMCIVGLSL